MYKNKYLKYKQKYLELKKLQKIKFGGNDNNDNIEIFDEYKKIKKRKIF